MGLKKKIKRLQKLSLYPQEQIINLLASSYSLHPLQLYPFFEIYPNKREAIWRILAQEENILQNKPFFIKWEHQPFPEDIIVELLVYKEKLYLQALTGCAVFLSTFGSREFWFDYLPYRRDVDDAKVYYGCQLVISVLEGSQELAINWDEEEPIKVPSSLAEHNRKLIRYRLNCDQQVDSCCKCVYKYCPAYPVSFKGRYIDNEFFNVQTQFRSTMV